MRADSLGVFAVLGAEVLRAARYRGAARRPSAGRRDNRAPGGKRARGARIDGLVRNVLRQAVEAGVLQVFLHVGDIVVGDGPRLEVGGFSDDRLHEHRHARHFIEGDAFFQRRVGPQGDERIGDDRQRLAGIAFDAVVAPGAAVAWFVPAVLASRLAAPAARGIALVPEDVDNLHGAPPSELTKAWRLGCARLPFRRLSGFRIAAPEGARWIAASTSPRRSSGSMA